VESRRRVLADSWAGKQARAKKRRTRLSLVEAINSYFGFKPISHLEGKEGGIAENTIY
jgi:hypothetical protein